MCELLGMSANVPTDICFSFTGLVQCGGGTGPHKDGWGITFYEGKGCCTFKDPQPSFNSPIAKLVQDYLIKSCLVVAHICQANWGEVALENTHLFTCELWGCNWTYAHNGQLMGYKSLETGNFCLVGETDSEKAFCWLLHKLMQCYLCMLGNMVAVFKYIASLVDELWAKGVFNMLLLDGCYVMVYCLTNLHWITCCVLFGVAMLLDQDVEIDFSLQTTLNDVVMVIVTQLLMGNETWQKIMPGEWCLFCLGECVV